MSAPEGWPSEADYTPNASPMHDAIYTRALLAKWQSVARVAVEALTKVGAFHGALGDGPHVETMHAVHGCLEEVVGTSIDALATIGTLPEKGE